MNRLDSEVISHDDNDWICIYKIDKNKLNDEHYYEDIFYGFMYNYLLYGLTVESIVAEK